MIELSTLRSCIVEQLCVIGPNSHCQPEGKLALIRVVSPFPPLRAEGLTHPPMVEDVSNGTGTTSCGHEFVGIRPANGGLHLNHTQRGYGWR
jgi:hypothetical protein